MKSSDPPAFLDTSVVVRYLTGDTPVLSNRAAEIIDSHRPLILSELALVETAHVLASVYGIPRAPLVDALIALVQRRNIRPLNTSKALILEALGKCRSSRRVSFTDALLWAEARQKRALRLYSFDQRFPADGLEIVGME
jgi:predicted nucleic acid-binding protein